MVAYTFYIYSVDVLSYDPDEAEFTLDAGYDYTTDRYRIEVSDDDAVMDASGDPTQTAIIYDSDNNVVNSGSIFVPQFAELDGGIFLDRIEVNGTHYGYVSNSPLTPGTSYEVVDSAVDVMNHTYYQANSVPCFGPDALIATPHGQVPIKNLRVGDKVITLDNGPQPILWTGARNISREYALRQPSVRPILIETAGPDGTLLTQPLILSPQHRVLLEHPMAQLVTGDAQVFIQATHLNSRHIPRNDFTWHHILLPEHDIVCANGLWVESLFADGIAAHKYPPPQRFAMLSAMRGRPHHKTARPCLRAFEARVLLSLIQSTAPDPTRNKRVA